MRFVGVPDRTEINFRITNNIKDKMEAISVMCSITSFIVNKNVLPIYDINVSGDRWVSHEWAL